IESILDIRTPSLGILSPDAKTLYVDWTVTGTRHVWKIPGPREFPIQMTGGEDDTSVAAITPDGKYLVLQRDRNGQEYPGLYLQKVHGGPLKKVIHEPKVQTSYQGVSDDSQYLYF